MLTRHLASALQYVLAIFIYAGAVSKSLRLPREKHFEPQKVVRDCGVLTILTSKSLSRHSEVQILLRLTSKSGPTMPVHFDFRIALAPQPDSVVQILETSLAADPPQLPLLGADFPSLRSHKTVEKHSISCNSYPPKPSHVAHPSCVASARSHLLVDRSSAATLSIVGS